MSARRLARAARLVALVPALAGCAAARAGTDRAPTLDVIRPDSVLVAPGSVVEVTLVGAGFRAGSPGANTVWFGTTAVRSVAASDDGRRITFVVPDAIESGGEAPPLRLVAGSYPVQVETSAGMSNALVLRVFR